MTLDPKRMRQRRSVMFALNALALLGALAAVVGYFKYAQAWALIAFVGALLVGFGAQIWFIAGLRRPKSPSMSKGA
jgi:energy-coupling factor transporter transmembrane protein EcfT